MTTECDDHNNLNDNQALTLIELVDAAVAAKGTRAKVAEALQLHPQRLTDWKASRGTPNATEIAYLAECAGLPPLETLAAISIQLDPRCTHIWLEALNRLRLHPVEIPSVGCESQDPERPRSGSDEGAEVPEEAGASIEQRLTLRELLDAAVTVKGSCRALAESLGRNPQHISDWKAGRRRPHTGEVARLAQLVGLPVPETVAAIETNLNDRYATVWRNAMDMLREADAGGGNDEALAPPQPNGPGRLDVATLIEEAVRRKGGRRAVAEGLGQGVHCLTDWKAGRRRPETSEIAHLAVCAGRPVMETVAALEAQRDERYASLWRNVLDQLRRIALAVALVCLSAVGNVPTEVRASGLTKTMSESSVSANQM
jgi:transcriptional regulator with XRE-family HTH domain